MNMGKILSLVACIIAISACAPKFNKEVSLSKLKKAVASIPTAAPVPHSGDYPVQGFDPLVAGGGSVGTSSSFKMSGVNISHLGKKRGTSTNHVLKGGLHGQLSRQ